MKADRTKRDMSNPEYRTWQGMKQRCYTVNGPSYKNYGGRGIKVYPEWIKSFDAFLSHMGEKPSLYHSIDRIDFNGDYVPGNVRWATAKEQGANQRRTILKTTTSCGMCGKEHTIFNYEKGKNHYCSYTCWKQSRRRRVTHVCDTCGQSYGAPMRTDKQNHYFFCSRRCYLLRVKQGRIRQPIEILPPAPAGARCE